MKHFFEEPEISVTEFSVADIITTSDDKTGSFDGEWVPLPFSEN